MPATYTSFDTLTIDLAASFGASGGDSLALPLPVLAEIPNVAAQPPKVTTEAPAPAHFEAKTPPPEAPAPPAPDAPAVSPPSTGHLRVDAPLSGARLPEPPHFATTVRDGEPEESEWATLLVGVEAAVRPHARLILLIALIAATGLMLVLLRAPAPTAPTESQRQMVETEPIAPSDTLRAQAAANPAQQAKDQKQEAAASSAHVVEPLPALTDFTPPGKSEARARASGPTGLPTNPEAGATPLAVTPVPVHREPNTSATPTPNPASAAPVRVAQRPAYPTSGLREMPFPQNQSPTTVPAIAPYAELRGHITNPTTGAPNEQHRSGLH